jgi:hypothetical protein
VQQELRKILRKYEKILHKNELVFRNNGLIMPKIELLVALSKYELILRKRNDYIYSILKYIDLNQVT